jgi:para-aminobenzoate synthetase component I
VESSPIKGTRPRGRASDQDAALARELLASEKDRAELAMIVDVTRNDLGRVCETGSVEVIQHAAQYARLMSLPTVHHLFSTVRGKLRPSSGLVDLLRAAFPAASITGAPKIEAMRAALREEGQWRGPCMGAIGWISLGRPDSMELSVAIRTAFVSEGRVRYYAGCGITADSIPASEFAESRHKAAAFVRALDRPCDPNGDDPNW